MNILIIDDYTLFREGLCYVLHKIEEDVRIFEASDYATAMQHLSDNPDMDLALLDLDLPSKDGFSLLEVMTKKYPAMPVVIISASEHRRDVKRALDVGARGYISKSTTSTLLFNALRLILSGGMYVPSNILGYIEEKVSTLTSRQLDVLELLVEGCSNKLIASRLGLTEATVKMHVTAIFKGLGVSNRTQAAMEARKLGLCLSYG